MGTDTAETPEVSTEEEAPKVELEASESEQPKEGEQVDVDGEQPEATEFEVVREGDEGSQPDKQRGIRKRINKLNNKIDEAVDGKAVSDEKNSIQAEQIKLLKLALEQKAPVEAVTPPDPNEFDDGVSDPKYIKALNEYQAPFITAEVQKQTSNLAPAQTDEVDPSLVKRQTKHYEEAEKLGAKDFEETEDKAIAILGNDTVKAVIGYSDKSHLILYYLGKNPDKAEAIAELINSGKPGDSIKATLQLGRLEAELSVKPRANSEPTPDPDEELQGGSPSAGVTNKHQRAVDAARKKVGETRDMAPLIAAKKAAKEAGVTVI